MSFKIRKIDDPTKIIDVLSMNINDEHEVLIFQDSQFETLRLDDFMDMIKGTNGSPTKRALGPTYELYEQR